MNKSMALLCMLSVMPFTAVMAKGPATADEKVSAVGASAATPPWEMAALYPRIGKWNVITRTLPGKSSPKGGLDHGVMIMKKGPGGFSIVQDYWSHGSSGDIIGQSFAWWDSSAKAYRSVWCDNTQGCIEFTTTIAGNSWETELDSEANGEKVRTVIHASMSADHNAIHEEAKSSYDGGPYQTETVSDYKRVAAQDSASAPNH
ncbi:hypothetical protein [Dyella nitratireducens]|uniref:DUF1579 domain-containing protein n=1 Tax=Dyella nitratireducens TaxID=1849580 RepID=A0ABQ1FSQ5_9GAMM|nr:hypothetical protein [Dyella nitratireducens]GGA29598.1 hypothetical protein GCM10010981_18190 [Dyella nitratireducens]GLQ43117.1 hypothetical protein GCM10007902_29670 [Dyella nitratireducens]